MRSVGVLDIPYFFLEAAFLSMQSLPNTIWPLKSKAISLMVGSTDLQGRQPISQKSTTKGE